MQARVSSQRGKGAADSGDRRRVAIMAGAGRVGVRGRNRVWVGGQYGINRAPAPWAGREWAGRPSAPAGTDEAGRGGNPSAFSKTTAPVAWSSLGTFPPPHRLLNINNVDTRGLSRRGRPHPGSGSDMNSIR
jgi:hypothetical protein